MFLFLVRTRPHDCGHEADACVCVFLLFCRLRATARTCGWLGHRALEVSSLEPGSQRRTRIVYRIY